MNRLIRLLLTIGKWPTALLVAAITPASASVLLNLLKQASGQGFWSSPFAVGFGASTAFWFVFGRNPFIVFWSTMEHEFTHALFAWCTFVPVRKFMTSDGTTLENGDRTLGEVQLDGSNWLISSAPYFFPTAPVALMAVTWILSARSTAIGAGLLGATIAYSILSTWRETHRSQTDLQKVGFPFAWLFLPGANLIAYSMLLGYQLGGPKEAGLVLTYPVELTRHWLGV
jgi:hypothetical protein